MKIDEVIRKYRKKRRLTQEQVAEYLGVSTPAVNKWERGAANPDIALLAPLARLLGIDVDTLLSFREELSREEIGRIGEEIVGLMEEKGFEAGLKRAMEKIREYPESGPFLLQTGQLLESGLLMYGGGEKEKDYVRQIEKLYERAGRSRDSKTAAAAKQMLIGACMGRGEYERAQELLDTLPESSYDKDTMQAALYKKQDRREEAAGLLEKKLLKEAAALQGIVISLLELACGEGEYERAERYARIAEQTAELYGLSPYGKKAPWFLLSMAQKDKEGCLSALADMAESLEKAWKPDTLLCPHIEGKKETGQECILLILKRALREDRELDFLREDERFRRIIED